MLPPFPPISKLKAGGTDARKAVAISIGYYRQPPALRCGGPGVVVSIEIALLGCYRNLTCSHVLPTFIPGHGLR